MKKLFTICLFVLIGFNTIEAQESTVKENFQHEFGIDFTDLIRQFFLSNNVFFPTAENVTESYTLSYRLMYKDKFNLRLGIGGNFNNGENSQDSLNFDIGSSAFRYRIGIDRMQPISKRWEAYYGLDFFQEQALQNNSFVSTFSNYISRREITGNRIGIAPLIGIRFRFNDRVGLQTSMNAEFYRSSNESITTYEILDPNEPSELPPNATISSNTNGLDINIPINLVLTFKL